MRPLLNLTNALPDKDLRIAELPPAAHLPHDVPDVELLLVIERWRDLPDAMRAGIVAMVMASGA